MTQYINNRAGNRMAADVIKLAEELQEGPGDGRISKADAKVLADKVNDAGVYTDPERRAVDHVRRTANFTDAGHDAFVHEMRSGGAERGWKTRLENQAKSGQLGAVEQQSGLASQIAALKQQQS